MVQRFGLSFLSFAIVLSLGLSARADQFVVTDVSYTHSKDTTEDSHYRLKPLTGTPTDWTKPVDYSKGTVHLIVDVKTKPAGDTPTKFQICFEGTPAYACTDQSPTYTKTGRVEWNAKFADFWYGGEVDWSKGTKQVALILKDTNNNKPQGDPKYVPTELHVQVTLVSPGASFVPPPAAGSGGSSGTGGSGGSVAAGSGGSGGSSGQAGMGGRGGRGGRGGAGLGGAGAGGAAGEGGAGAAAVSGSGGASGAGGVGRPAGAGRGGAGMLAAGTTASAAGATPSGGAGMVAGAGTAGGIGSMSDAQTADDAAEDSGCRAAGTGATPVWMWILGAVWLWSRRRCQQR